MAYWGYVWIMENTIESAIVYRGYMGAMENKIETAIVYWGFLWGTWKMT